MKGWFVGRPPWAAAGPLAGFGRSEKLGQRPARGQPFYFARIGISHSAATYRGSGRGASSLACKPAFVPASALCESLGPKPAEKPARKQDCLPHRQSAQRGVETSLDAADKSVCATSPVVAQALGRLSACRLGTRAEAGKQDCPPHPTEVSSGRRLTPCCAGRRP